MKRFILAACLSSWPGAALLPQESISSHESRIGVKFSPAGLAVGKITFGGEYNYRPRHSITFQAGFPFGKTQTLHYDGSESDIRSEAFSLMAGYRYYLGQKTMNGFYIEPYAKYLTHKASGLLNGELNGDRVVFDSHSRYKGLGIGAQFGVQFIIAKLVIADLFLVGPEANSAKFSSTSTDITDNIIWTLADEREAEEDIREVFKDIPIVGDQIEVKVNRTKKTVSTNFSGFVPGFRIGASVGIRF